MALWLKRSNTLFLHIPKTGGTWVEEALRVGGVPFCEAVPIFPTTPRHEAPRHFDMRRYNEAFCFVREPLEWYRSWFRFNHQRWQHWTDYHHPCDAIARCASNSYDEYTDKLLRYCRGFVTDMYAQYTRTSPIPVMVGQTERVASTLCKFLRRFGERFDEAAVLDLDPINSSDHQIHTKDIRERELARHDEKGNYFWKNLTW